MSDLSEAYVRTRHKISGVIDEATPRHIAEHEILGKHLEIVGPEAKPYLPEMHRVSLPLDASPDDISAAKAAGLDDKVAELNAAREAARAEAEVVDEDPKTKIGKS